MWYTIEPSVAVFTAGRKKKAKRSKNTASSVIRTTESPVGASLNDVKHVDVSTKPQTPASHSGLFNPCRCVIVFRGKSGVHASTC